MKEWYSLSACEDGVTDHICYSIFYFCSFFTWLIVHFFSTNLVILFSRLKTIRDLLAFGKPQTLSWHNNCHNLFLSVSVLISPLSMQFPVFWTEQLVILWMYSSLPFAWNTVGPNPSNQLVLILKAWPKNTSQKCSLTLSPSKLDAHPLFRDPFMITLSKVVIISFSDSLPHCPMSILRAQSTSVTPEPRSFPDTL